MPYDIGIGKTWREEDVKKLDAELVEAYAIIEAIEAALNGEEPSDFMLSFPVVRKAWDLSLMCDRLEATD